MQKYTKSLDKFMKTSTWWETLVPYCIQTWKCRTEEDADSPGWNGRQFVKIALEYWHDGRPHRIHVRTAYSHVAPDAVLHRAVTWRKQQVREIYTTAMRPSDLLL